MKILIGSIRFILCSIAARSSPIRNLKLGSHSSESNNRNSSHTGTTEDGELDNPKAQDEDEMDESVADVMKI